MTKRYKPLIGKMFYAIWVPTALLMVAVTLISAEHIGALLIMLATDVFTFYFLFSSLAAYVELRDSSLFIKFGFIKKQDIPYAAIRAVSKERKFYSDSMISIKNSLEHVNIKYNRFDLVCVSVRDNDGFMRELGIRITPSESTRKRL